MFFHLKLLEKKKPHLALQSNGLLDTPHVRQGGVRHVQSSCKTELLAAYHVVLLPPWSCRAVREGDDSQRAVWAAHGLDHGSPLGHCDTAESFPQRVPGLQAPFDSFSDENRKGPCEWDFSVLFQCIFKKLKIVQI